MRWKALSIFALIVGTGVAFGQDYNTSYPGYGVVRAGGGAAKTPPTYIGGTVASNGLGQLTITINYPTGHAAGQTAYTYFALNGSATVSGAKSWTLVKSGSTAGLFTPIMRRQLDGSEGASETFTMSGGGVVYMANMRLYSGVNTTTPEDTAVGNPVLAFGSTGQPTTATFTTVQNGDRIVSFVTDWSRCATFTAPTGFGNPNQDTLCADSDSTSSWDMAQSTAGSIGQVTAGGATSGDQWGIAVLALQPN